MTWHDILQLKILVNDFIEGTLTIFVCLFAFKLCESGQSSKYPQHLNIYQSPGMTAGSMMKVVERPSSLAIPLQWLSPSVPLQQCHVPRLHWNLFYRITYSRNLELWSSTLCLNSSFTLLHSYSTYVQWHQVLLSLLFSVLSVYQLCFNFFSLVQIPRWVTSGTLSPPTSLSLWLLLFLWLISVVSSTHRSSLLEEIT